MRTQSSTKKSSLKGSILREGDNPTKEVLRQIDEERGIGRMLQDEFGRPVPARYNKAADMVEVFVGGKWKPVSLPEAKPSTPAKPIQGGGTSPPGQGVPDPLTLQNGLRVDNFNGVLEGQSGIVGVVGIGNSLAYSPGSLDTTQDIRASAAPSFAGMTLTGDVTISDGKTVDGVDLSAWLDQSVKQAASPEFSDIVLTNTAQSVAMKPAVPGVNGKQMTVHAAAGGLTDTGVGGVGGDFVGHAGAGGGATGAGTPSVGGDIDFYGGGGGWSAATGADGGSAFYRGGHGGASAGVGGNGGNGTFASGEGHDGGTDGNVYIATGATNRITITGSTGAVAVGTSAAQLLGFYGQTPVNQPDTVADAATQDLTGANTVDKTKLEADLTSCKTAINAIIARLEELGLIAT